MKLQVPASSLHAWIPSAVLELFLISTAAQWILWAETRPLQWLSIWVRVAEQLWLPWYYCVFPPYTVPRAVFGEPCENEEIEGSLVVVYCSLFSLALLLQMHSTYVWFAAIDVCLRKFCMFRMCFHVYSWFSNPVFLFVCFPKGKESAGVSGSHGYVLLLILPLSLYCHTCFLLVSYCKCPTWKWAFLDFL